MSRGRGRVLELRFFFVHVIYMLFVCFFTIFHVSYIDVHVSMKSSHAKTRRSTHNDTNMKSTHATATIANTTKHGKYTPTRQQEQRNC